MTNKGRPGSRLLEWVSSLQKVKTHNGYARLNHNYRVVQQKLTETETPN